MDELDVRKQKHTPHHMNIHLLKQGTPFGPYTEAEISDMLENNEARLTDAAWKEGNPDWTTIGHVLGLEPPPPPRSETFTSPPPVPQQHFQAQQIPYSQGKTYVYVQNTKYCPKCKQEVEVNETNKFVGIARGITQKVGKCSICGTKLYGPACFIATAVYGDIAHPDVVALRSFRDIYIASTKTGCILIDIYYQIGPRLATACLRRPFLSKIIRSILQVLVYSVKLLNSRDTKTGANLQIIRPRIQHYKQRSQ